MTTVVDHDLRDELRGVRAGDTAAPIEPTWTDQQTAPAVPNTLAATGLPIFDLPNCHVPVVLRMKILARCRHRGVAKPNYPIRYGAKIATISRLQCGLRAGWQI